MYWIELARSVWKNRCPGTRRLAVRQIDRRVLRPLADRGDTVADDFSRDRLRAETLAAETDRRGGDLGETSWCRNVPAR